MILNQKLETQNTWCILHVCGDDPSLFTRKWSIFRYSPRMWRWSLPVASGWVPSVVFSTYVEMILFLNRVFTFLIGILHVCGDDPISVATNLQIFGYSPRMWRWSLNICHFYFSFYVFSTYVEMILYDKTLERKVNCILHVCGDDPVFKSTHLKPLVYSPRMWRWSLTVLIWR